MKYTTAFLLAVLVVLWPTAASAKCYIDVPLPDGPDAADIVVSTPESQTGLYLTISDNQGNSCFINWRIFAPGVKIPVSLAVELCPNPDSPMDEPSEPLPPYTGGTWKLSGFFNQDVCPDYVVATDYLYLPAIRH